MNLYELTQNAISQFNKYRHPNLDSWQEEIDKILSALGESTIDHIYFREDKLYIRTSYSVLCCSQNNTMSIPISILKSENPIQKASIFYLEKQILNEQDRIFHLQKELTTACKQLENTKKLYEGAIQ
jgi:hypothetical protein